MFEFKKLGAFFEKMPSKLHIYAGVFLLKTSRDDLLDLVFPVHQNIYADHVTTFYKPSDEVVLEYMTQKRIAPMLVHSYAEDEKGQAIGVKFTRPEDQGLSREPEKELHITISCAEGTPPVYSNELMKKAEKLKYPFIIVGFVGVCSHTDRNFLPLEMWSRRGLASA